MIKCSFCQKLKMETEFIKDCTQPTGYHQRCRNCEILMRELKKKIPLLSPVQKRKLLLKLYIEYNQFPTQLYRIFSCDVKYIYDVLQEEDLRRCKCCLELKSYSEFYKQKNSEDGFNRWCKQCAKSRSNESMRKSYHNNPQNKQQKNYIWREQNIDHHRELMLTHYYNNKDQYRHNNRKRQQIKSHALPPWADLNEIKSIYMRARDLELIDNIPRHVDHIIPLQHDLVCGLHVENNLQILTDVENRQKSNKFTPFFGCELLTIDDLT